MRGVPLNQKINSRKDPAQDINLFSYEYGAGKKMKCMRQWGKTICGIFLLLPTTLCVLATKWCNIIITWESVD